MSQHRKHRGYETQKIVADYFRNNGWPYAEPVGAGRPGSDVTGMPGIDIECKARRKLDLTGTLQQQSERSANGVVPLAIVRPDGWGPKRINDWPVIMPLHVAVQLLREGGYGNELDG